LPGADHFPWFMNGDDVTGMVVDVAARVLAQAGASEVPVTRTIKDLLAGSGPTFVSQGIHQFKGVPDTWEPYAQTVAAPLPEGVGHSAVRSPPTVWSTLRARCSIKRAEHRATPR
jgi:hypothetical protein